MYLIANYLNKYKIMETEAKLIIIGFAIILIIGAFFALKGLASAFEKQEVINKERKFGSAEKYIKINGNLLFTEKEIAVAKKRAEKNKEDL